jgi:polyisoprenoid-binding protein YceI
MLKPLLATALTLALGVAITAPAAGQPAGNAPPPAAPSKDPAAAPAGVYNIDLNHSSVIARVPHGNGLSFSTMRFGVTKGVLTWDPANAANIKLDVAVDTKAHVDPIVYRLAPDAPQMLNAAMFPQATFVSSAVKRTGPAKADVEGQMTIIGVTKPAVIHVQLIGVGKNGQGKAIMGFTGSIDLKRSDFGKPFLPNLIGDNVELTVDGEFIGS